MRSFAAFDAHGIGARRLRLHDDRAVQIRAIDSRATLGVEPQGLDIRVTVAVLRAHANGNRFG
jgi:hypothetical protein